MKKIFTLFALAMATLTASATDYSDNLKVTLGGITSEQPATISVEELSDGNYTLTLKDFSLNIGGQSLDVGNIVISGAKAVQKDGIKGFALAQAVNIAAGSDNSKSWIGPSLGEVPLKLSAEFTNDKLFTVIKIAMNGMSIDVQFGNRFSEAFYQAQNSNFEEFVGSGKTLEPKYWHSFGSASGSFAGFVNGTQKVFQSPDVRPGSTGSSSVKIISTSTWGTIANGNLTTGRVMAGGFSAGSTANNNTSDPTSADLNIKILRTRPTPTLLRQLLRFHPKPMENGCVCLFLSTIRQMMSFLPTFFSPSLPTRHRVRGQGAMSFT